MQTQPQTQTHTAQSSSAPPMRERNERYYQATIGRAIATIEAAANDLHQAQLELLSARTNGRTASEAFEMLDSLQLLAQLDKRLQNLMTYTTHRADLHPSNGNR